MAKQNTKNKTNKNQKNKTTNTGSKKVNTNEKVKKDIKKEVEVKKIKKEVEVKEIKKEEKKVVTPAEKKEEKKSFKLTSKQKDIVLILLVVVLLIVAGIVTSVKKEKVDIELPAVVEGEAGTRTITYSEYEELMASNKPFLAVVINDGCHYCEMYEPIVEEVANEYGIPVNYINLAKLSSDEYNSLSNSNSYLRTKKWGTPTTLFMVGNKVIDSIGQYVDKDTFVSFIKENIKVD